MGSATKDGYFFQYNDFSSNVIKNFQDFRDKKELYDVTLTCDDHSFVQVKNKTVLTSVKIFIIMSNGLAYQYEM